MKLCGESFQVPLFSAVSVCFALSQPTFGFAFLGELYDMYKGKSPCESVKFKCKCHHVSIGLNSRHICTKRPKVELYILNLQSFRYLPVFSIILGPESECSLATCGCRGRWPFRQCLKGSKKKKKKKKKLFFELCQQSILVFLN